MQLRRLTPFDRINALQALVDAGLLLVAWALAFWLRFNLEVPAEYRYVALVTTPVCLLSYALSLGVLRVHRQVWDFIGLPDLRQLALGVVLGGVLTATVILMLRVPLFPRSVLLLHPVLVLVLLGAVRAAWRTLIEHPGRTHAGRKPLVVVGSLQDASGALRALQGVAQWQAEAILSPVASEVGRALQNVRVLGSVGELKEVCDFVHAHTVLVASPPGSPERREALMLAADARIAMLHMPRADQWLSPQPEGVRQVELEDLLGREPVQLDVAGLAELFSGQTVLVTGAGGSIGSELCRQIARLGARRLVCVDLSEFGLYALEQELRQAHPAWTASTTPATCATTSACGRSAASTAHRRLPRRGLQARAADGGTQRHRGAAHQRDRHPARGALRPPPAGRAASCWSPPTRPSTPPTSWARASGSAGADGAGRGAAGQGTEFVSVRFGNVLGSSGSVVPLFTRQIARGGPVTVTHPEIVRYFMTIPEAAQLVLQAGLMGRSGQIFVLDMGEPVKIVELARMLIRPVRQDRAGSADHVQRPAPGREAVRGTARRAETSEPTPHPKLRIAKTSGPLPEVAAVLHWMEHAGPQPASEDLRAWLRRQVPEYVPAGRCLQVVMPVRVSTSLTSSSRTSGLSSSIRRCLSATGSGSSSHQRFATQPQSSSRQGGSRAGPGWPWP
jgi:FlaA1/EpsC-like NDP-sugar epimerase